MIGSRIGLSSGLAFFRYCNFQLPILFLALCLAGHFPLSPYCTLKMLLFSDGSMMRTFPVVDALLLIEPDVRALTERFIQL